jgi:transposase-like protein
MRSGVRRAMNEAYGSADAELAKRRLERLARALESDHPSAAASLREGLEETLTLQRLGIGGTLYRTLRSTNPIENLNGSVAQYMRNVKRWRGGQMLLRWVSAALRETHGRFRRIRGHREMPRLLAALAKHERELQSAHSTMDTKWKTA